MRSSKLKYYLLIFLLFPLNSFSQEKKREKVLKDTIECTNANYQSSKDTLFINNQIKSDQFYDSLINRASKNKITKTALGLLLVKEPAKGSFIGIEDLRNEEYYGLYSGKKIRKIEILKLDIFGPTLRDTTLTTTRWMERSANNIHVKTRDFIIKNNLFFQPEDTINPKLLVDNERFLRELDYIRDASIQVVEIPGNPDYVDLLIITKDVFSMGFNIDLYNEYSGLFELYENNLAGIGHKIEANLQLDSRENPATGYEFNYKIDNISGTFIRSQIQYLKAFNTEKIGVELNRDFITYQTKWAGGVNLYQTSTLRDIKKVDTTLLDVRLNYSTQDIWIGRSFLIKTNNWQFQDRTRLVLTARYENNTFYKGPEVQERYNYPYHDNQIGLLGIAYTRQKYFKSNLIYAFGKTEDIPIGTLIQLNAGIEKDEFYERPYFGLKLSNGNYYPKIGYLNLHAEIGGFYYNSHPEQGVFKITTQAISNLHYFNRLKLREFVSINYTRGVNRFVDEKVFINNSDITGFNTDYLYGLQKVSFHSELVAFSNLYIYNFRFLFFGFGDLALVGPENKSVFSNKLYSGVGLGIRIRNENLVFKTFQIKVAFYPTVPEDITQFYYNISGESYQKPTNFEPTAPNIIDFN